MSLDNLEIGLTNFFHQKVGSRPVVKKFGASSYINLWKEYPNEIPRFKRYIVAAFVIPLFNSVL